MVIMVIYCTNNMSKTTEVNAAGMSKMLEIAYNESRPSPDINLHKFAQMVGGKK